MEGFTAGTVELPVKSGSVNPAELTEFLMQYKQMADAYGYNEKIAI